MSRSGASITSEAAANLRVLSYDIERRFKEPLGPMRIAALIRRLSGSVLRQAEPDTTEGDEHATNV